MKASPKTIQIFLPDGHPRSLKIVELTNRITQAVLIPRNKLDEAKKRKETQNVSAYFLFGEYEDKAKPYVYIGQAENGYIRLKQHNQKKDFWNTAVLITSKTSSLTKTHVQYLEWLCCSKAKEVQRYELDNSVLPSKPSTTESMEADLLESFEEINLLLATLNFPLFEDIKKSKKTSLLYCKGKDALAEGDYIDDGLIVFKGSIANLSEVPTCGPATSNLRKRLLESGILKKQKNIYLFASDYIFTSPSTAAGVVLGRSANGWVEWKNKQGQTLDELKRQDKD